MMFLGSENHDFANIEVDGHVITSSENVKFLSVTIDKKLSFKEHISNLCKLANNKANALLRIRRYIDTDKERALCYAYVLSVFNYCCLIWMFCNKDSNNKINHTHKRALGTVYSRRDLSLEELLYIDGNVKIHCHQQINVSMD